MKHPVCWYGTEHVQKWVWELIWKGRVQITAWYHPPPALPPRLCPFTFPFTQLDTCQMPLNKKKMKLCLCVMSSHLTWIKIYFLVRKNLIIMWTEYLVFLVNVNCRWGYILTLAKIVLSPKKTKLFGLTYLERGCTSMRADKSGVRKSFYWNPFQFSRSFFK
jgi:hypothetical protein